MIAVKIAMSFFMISSSINLSFVDLIVDGFQREFAADLVHAEELMLRGDEPFMLQFRHDLRFQLAQFAVYLNGDSHPSGLAVLLLIYQ